jgi:periplasmic protein TonB
MSNPRTLDPEIQCARFAAPDDGSTATFLLALAAAAALHLAAILLVSFEAPVRETGIADSAMEILILRETGTVTRQPATDAIDSHGDRSTGSPTGGAITPDPVAILADETALEETVSSVPESDAASPVEVAEQPEAETRTEQVAPIPGADPSAAVEPAVVSSREQTLGEPPTDELIQPDLWSQNVAGLRSAEAAPESVPDPLPDPMDTRETTIDAAQIFASRNAEIDRLNASLQAKNAAYASRVRRKSVDASTRELSYASYLGAWARKVERIGNLNYPQAAKDQRMFGSLILHVAIRADGSVEQIRVVRSSGYALLDEAAARIVELAAPYAPFPPDIAAETDVLDIVRTWQFLRGGGLGWEQ